MGDGQRLITRQITFSETFDTTASLGMRLSQELVVLGFASDSKRAAISVAESRGSIKAGDRIVRLGGHNTTRMNLVQFAQKLRSLPRPVTLTFEGSRMLPPDSDPVTSHEGSGAEDASFRLLKSAFSVKFTAGERTGLAFDDGLRVRRFVLDAAGNIPAVQRLEHVSVGDTLIAINGENEPVRELLRQKWPSLTALHKIEALPRPMTLHFLPADGDGSFKRVSDLQNHLSPGDLRADNFEHVDLAVEGTHHRHDAGHLGESNSAYRILRAEFGASPTCARRRLEIADPMHGCGELNREVLAGTFVVAVRGHCTFVDKARNVQAAGGVGLLVLNNAQHLVRMPGGVYGEDVSDVRIPVAMVEQAAAKFLRLDRILGRAGDMPGGEKRRITARLVVSGLCVEQDRAWHRQSMIGADGVDDGDPGGNREADSSGDGGYIVGYQGRPRHVNAARSANLVRGGELHVHCSKKSSTRALSIEFLLAHPVSEDVIPRLTSLGILPRGSCNPDSWHACMRKGGSVVVRRENQCQITSILRAAVRARVSAVLLEAEADSHMLQRPQNIVPDELQHPGLLVAAWPPGTLDKVLAWQVASPTAELSLLWDVDNSVADFWSSLSKLQRSASWPRADASRRRLKHRLLKRARDNELRLRAIATIYEYVVGTEASVRNEL